MLRVGNCFECISTNFWLSLYLLNKWKFTILAKFLHLLLLHDMAITVHEIICSVD